MTEVTEEDFEKTEELLREFDYVIFNEGCYLEKRRAIAQFRATARAEERERCAREVDGIEERANESGHTVAEIALGAASRAIRSLK